jgi:hypothetical protein
MTLAREAVAAFRKIEFPAEHVELLSAYRVEQLAEMLAKHGRDTIVMHGINPLIKRFQDNGNLEPDLKPGRVLCSWSWFTPNVPKPAPAAKPAPRKQETEREWRARMDELRRKSEEERAGRRAAWLKLAEPLVERMKAAGFAVSTTTTKSRGQECKLLTPSELDDLYRRFPREALLGADLRAVLHRAVDAFIANPGTNREGNPRTSVTAWSNLGQHIKEALSEWRSPQHQEQSS